MQKISGRVRRSVEPQLVRVQTAKLHAVVEFGDLGPEDLEVSDGLIPLDVLKGALERGEVHHLVWQSPGTKSNGPSHSRAERRLQWPADRPQLTCSRVYSPPIRRRFGLRAQQELDHPAGADPMAGRRATTARPYPRGSGGDRRWASHSLRRDPGVGRAEGSRSSRQTRLIFEESRFSSVLVQSFTFLLTLALRKGGSAGLRRLEPS